MYLAFLQDLRKIGRPIDRVAIVDNSPNAYILTPDNAIPITSWFSSKSDVELRDLIPLLEEMAVCESVPKWISARIL
jgi:carboxy-terminal domain RNA polymerase II polypeptide A small phosphatase